MIDSDKHEKIMEWIKNILAGLITFAIVVLTIIFFCIM
jgi:type IV secretory pathway VirB2 component (pilin)